MVSFARWLGDEAPNHGPVYWIRGKPGSGKSTLMKFAMNDARLNEHLRLKSKCHWIVAAYFFHDRGFEIQKTLEGMLQELLYSILQQGTALLSIVTPLYMDLVRLQKTQTPKWDIKSLRAALIAIIEQSRFRVRILLFIDALDEHSGDNDTLALLLKLQKAGQDSCKLKLCLASRSWNVFRQHFATCPGFAIHEHTRDDVRTYIESRLRPSHGVETTVNARSLSKIIDLITDKALGVFIWVKLVVDVVSKGIRDGTRYSVLEAEVNRMPPKLKDLYADTLRRVEPNYSTEAYIMLHMVYSSLVPLPLDTFMASLDVNLTDEFNISPFGPTETAAEYIAAQKSRLASRSGGLLEIIPTGVSTQSAHYPWNLVVQFIHQTVKDYIQASPHELGLLNVVPQLGEQSGNMFLLKACRKSSHAWSGAIRRDIFKYAIGAFADDGSASHVIIESLKEALLVYNMPNLLRGRSNFSVEQLAGSSSTRTASASPSFAEAAGRGSTADVTRLERDTEMQPKLKEGGPSQSSMSENKNLSVTNLDDPSQRFLITEDKRPVAGYGLSWWLNEYLKAAISNEAKSFCSTLYNICESGGDFSSERVLAMLAVAMRFEGYIKFGLPSRLAEESRSIYPGLLHLAAAGPELKMANSSIDRSNVIELVIQAWPHIDEEFDCSTFHRPSSDVKKLRLSPINHLLLPSSDVQKLVLSPINYLLLHKSEQDEKSRLRIAKTLFALGASPFSAIEQVDLRKVVPVGDMGREYGRSPIEHCVILESAAFVRLWLHQIDVMDTEYFNLEKASKLLHFAILRQDKAINEVLQEHKFGFTFDTGTVDPGTRLRIVQLGVASALVMSSQVLSAPSGRRLCYII